MKFVPICAQIYSGKWPIFCSKFTISRKWAIFRGSSLRKCLKSSQVCTEYTYLKLVGSWRGWVEAVRKSLVMRAVPNRQVWLLSRFWRAEFAKLRGQCLAALIWFRGPHAPATRIIWGTFLERAKAKSVVPTGNGILFDFISLVLSLDNQNLFYIYG